MKLRDFIVLLEYRRDKTLQNFGEKLKERGKTDPGAKKLSAEQILDIIERGDPTKKKSYVPWLAKTYINNPANLEDLVSGTGDDLIKFDELKNRKKLEGDADIGRIKDPDQLSRIVGKHEHKLKDDTKKERKEEERGDYKYVFKGKETMIVQLRDKKAAKFWGKGTAWCTAAEGSNYYEHYAKQGDIYVIVLKNPRKYEHERSGKPREEKYQLHLASRSCKDENDYGYKFGKLIKRFPELQNAFVGIEEYKPLKQLYSMTKAEKAKRKKREATAAKKRDTDISSLIGSFNVS